MKMQICFALLAALTLTTACGGPKTPPVPSSSVSSQTVESSVSASSEPAVTQSDVDKREGEIAHMEAYFSLLGETAATLGEIDSQEVLSALEGGDETLALEQIGTWQSVLQELQTIQPPEAFLQMQTALSSSAQTLWDYLDALRVYAESPAAEEETERLRQADELRAKLENAKNDVSERLQDALDAV